MAGIDQYRKGLRSAVRGLWSGTLTIGQAENAFEAAIGRRITQAWNEGAAECDIKPDELSEAEILARDEFIENQIEFAPSFLEDVAANSKANKGKLKPLLTRTELWVNQYSSAKQRSEAMACGDEKRIWVLGRTEHCRSCLALNGQVRRLSFWESHVLPRNAPNDRLECKGFNCQCTLKSTKKPISKGRLPRLP